MAGQALRFPARPAALTTVALCALMLSVHAFAGAS
jgi:hypothetical protein